MNGSHKKSTRRLSTYLDWAACAAAAALRLGRRLGAGAQGGLGGFGPLGGLAAVAGRVVVTASARGAREGQDGHETSAMSMTFALALTLAVMRVSAPVMLFSAPSLGLIVVGFSDAAAIAGQHASVPSRVWPAVVTCIEAVSLLSRYDDIEQAHHSAWVIV